MRRSPTSQCGFSLVEVILALGIFSFAIVTILALFGGVFKNTRSLADREATGAIWQSLTESIADMPASSLFAIPSGTNVTGRPDLFARVVQPATVTNAMSIEVESSATGFTNAPADARLYRARLFRAPLGSNEAPWLSNQAYYPLRVQVDSFVASAYSPTNQPTESTTLNLIWNAH